MQPQHVTRSTSRLLAFSALGAAGAVVLAGCGGSSSNSAGPNGGSAGSGTSKVENVTITAASGCALSARTLPAGAITFDVKNQDATAVSEVELLDSGRIIGEKENLPPGFGGSFAVNVAAGTYTLYCPGAPKENIPVTVTGKAPTGADTSTTALLASGTKDYAGYISTQVGYLVAGAKALQHAIAVGNLSDAQAQYDKARPFYEKVEPVADSFTIGKNSLDADIDARINDVPASQFEGFHRIEQGLFQAKSTKGLAPYAAGLVKNTEKLQSLTAGLSYKPFELANGAQDLLDEVATTKVTGEEERYSHIDLLDFEANDEGAEQAFADLQPALKRIDPTLASTIASRFTALDALVDTYRTGSNPSGFDYYSALTNADKRKLANAVKSVQEPLSQVASKVANG